MEDPLDFSDLMERAQRNDEDNQIAKNVKRYNLELSRNKRDGQACVDPRAVQRVLAQKKREAIRQRVEEQQKKDRLMQERAQNRKASGRISSMLKRTKSAIKGAVAPDEAYAPANSDLVADDFGYTSSTADQIHAKLMKKYEEKPLPDIFSNKKRPAMNIEATKARMKQALDDDEDDPHGTKRKKLKASETPSPSKDDDSPRPTSSRESSRLDDKKSERDREREAERLRRKQLAAKAPPPLTYDDLMQKAAKNSLEPAKFKVEDALKPSKPAKEYEFDRPMTAKEKEEFLRERNAKLRREGKIPRNPPPAPAAAAPSQAATSSSSFKKPGPASKTLAKPPTVEKRPSEAGRVPDVQQKKPERTEQTPVVNKPMKDRAAASSSSVPKRDTTSVPNGLAKKKPAAVAAPALNRATPTVKTAKQPQPYVPQRVTEEYVPKPVTGAYVPKPVTGAYVPKPVPGAGSSGATYKATKIPPKPASGPSGAKPGPASKTGKPNAVGGPVSSASKQMVGERKGEKRPNSDTWSQLEAQRKAKAGGVGVKKPKPPPPRRRIESDSEEEEYDSELDDFIDDGPLEGEMDFSSEIQKMFGYDRRRYANLDDEDDECMEASYSEQMKEEFKSTKAGILEDLREARLEKMRKKKALGKR